MKPNNNRYQQNQALLLILPLPINADTFMFESTNHSRIKDSFAQLCAKFQSKKDLLSLTTNENRSILANYDISFPSKILEVPFQYFISAEMEMIKSSPLFKYIQILDKQLAIQSSLLNQARKLSAIYQYLKKVPNFNLLLFLIEKKYMKTLVHKDPQIERIYQHYMATLPKNYEYHPSNYAEEIRQYHYGIYFYLDRINQRVEETAQKLKELFFCKGFSSSVPSFKRFLRYQNKENLYLSYLHAFTNTNLHWAFHVIQTRQFTRKLIPLLDLVNHSQDNNSQWIYDNQRKNVTLYSIKDIKAGQQILGSYGASRSMQQLFEICGFFSTDSVCQFSIPICFNESINIVKRVNEMHDMREYLLKKWYATAFPSNERTIHMYERFSDSCWKERNKRISYLNCLQKFIREGNGWSSGKKEVFQGLLGLLSSQLRIIEEIITCKKCIFEDLQSRSSQ